MLMFFKKEFIQTVSKREFFASILVGFGLLFMGLGYFYSLNPSPPPGANPAYYNAFDAWRQGLKAGIFVLFAPLLASLSSASSYLEERESRFSRYVLLRMPHRQYLVCKYLINVIVGGLSIAIPLLLFYGYTLLVYARSLPPLLQTPYTEEWMRAPGFLGGIYSLHPSLYIFARIGLGFVFGITYSTLGMAVSRFVHHKYLTTIIPLLFYWLLGFIANFINLPVFWSAYALQTDGILTSSLANIFLPMLLLFTLTTLCIFISIKKYDSKEMY